MGERFPIYRERPRIRPDIVVHNCTSRCGGYGGSEGDS
jgi:hypothetical protein